MKREATPFAKITRPSAEGILPRRRLFQLLDRARHHPILWVSGPPGSGKTSLVASYLDSRKLPCLWYQVDEGDSDIATFFYYMGLAGKKPPPERRNLFPFSPLNICKVFRPLPCDILKIFSADLSPPISLSWITIIGYPLGRIFMM